VEQIAIIVVLSKGEIAIVRINLHNRIKVIQSSIFLIVGLFSQSLSQYKALKILSMGMEAPLII